MVICISHFVNSHYEGGKISDCLWRKPLEDAEMEGGLTEPLHLPEDAEKIAPSEQVALIFIEGDDNGAFSAFGVERLVIEKSRVRGVNRVFEIAPGFLIQVGELVIKDAGLLFTERRLTVAVVFCCGH